MQKIILEQAAIASAEQIEDRKRTDEASLQKMIEEGGSRLKAEAEDFGQNFRSRRDINKLGSLIRDDYVNIGLLVYELHKRGKTFDFSDFEVSRKTRKEPSFIS